VQLKERLPDLRAAITTEAGVLPVYVVCRRGIASKIATSILLTDGIGNVFDIEGGFAKWAFIDPQFPKY
jgi:rhodanese-related sulfurtransferase